MQFSPDAEATLGLIAETPAFGIRVNGIALVTGFLNGFYERCYDQPPNIARVDAFQRISFSITPVSGSFVLNFRGVATAPILYTDTPFLIEQKMNVLPGLEEPFDALGINGVINSGAGLGIVILAIEGPVELFTVTNNTTGAVITVYTDTAGVAASGAYVWSVCADDVSTTWSACYSQPSTTWSLLPGG